MYTDFRNHQIQNSGQKKEKNNNVMAALNSVVLYKKKNRKVCQNGDKVKPFKQIQN